MSKKTEQAKSDARNDESLYSDAPLDVEKAFERSIPVPDFLPSPAELMGEATKQKVTIMLDTRIVDFFKSAAKEYGGHYQTMMNNLLASYVDKYSEGRSGATQREA